MFQFTAQRHAVRDPAATDSAQGSKFGDVVGTGFTLDGRIGGENEFLDLAAVEARLQQVQTELVGTDSVQR